jgi:hypothetical protein
LMDDPPSPGFGAAGSGGLMDESCGRGASIMATLKLSTLNHQLSTFWATGIPPGK